MKRKEKKWNKIRQNINKLTETHKNYRFLISAVEEIFSTTTTDEIDLRVASVSYEHQG